MASSTSGTLPDPHYRLVMEAALAARDEGSFTDYADVAAGLTRIAADGRLARYLAEGWQQRPVRGARAGAVDGRPDDHG
jgi:hypothetical protein